MPLSIATKQQYKNVTAYRTLTAQPIKLLLIISIIAALLLVALFFVIFNNAIILGLAIVAIAVAIGALLPITFASTYYPYRVPDTTIAELIKASATGKDVNIAKAASFELVTALSRHARRGKKSSKTIEKSLHTLVHSVYVRHMLRRLQITPKGLLHVIHNTVIDELSWEFLTTGAVKIAHQFKEPYVYPEHILGAVLLHPRMQIELRNIDLTEDDIQFNLWWETNHRRNLKFRARWWNPDRMLAFTGIGLSWASGFTPLVDKFARLPQGNVWDDVLYGHEEKVDELINTLARQRQSNVLLVGDPGVGRIGIIRELSRRIVNGQAHPDLMGQRLLYINVGELIAAGGGTDASQLAIVSQALREMERSGDIVAVIDGLSTVLGGTGESRINLTDILLPFLSSPTVRVVVITSTEEYHLRLKSNQELIHYFEAVQVPSLSIEDTMKRVALTLPPVERGAHLFAPYKTVRTLVHDTASIMPQIPFPERAYDFLEEAIVLAQNEQAKLLEDKHIHTIIQHKIGVNLGSLRGNEREKLLNLESIMHQRMVNQNTAINTLARAMVRARAEVRSTKRPIGSFLFLGPTGVGKTETAKTLAETYFGSEENMVRLDMSEFSGPDAVARLIGSAENRTGRLTSLISDNPFTVLLLDEFEKATSQVHQLFLQVLDEGRLTDAAGRQYSFLHTIIIATSNAGAEMIRQEVKDGVLPDGFDTKLKDHILAQNLLRPELLNRFDAVITYVPLTEEHIRDIAGLMLRSLNKRLDAKHGITVKVTDDLISFLVSIGYNPEFGARPMTRAIQDTVEYTIAQQVLRNEVNPGQQIQLNVEQLKSISAPPQ